MSSTDDIQRTLGKLEGKLDEIIRSQSDARQAMINHEGDDRNNFQGVNSRFAVVFKRIEDSEDTRAALFAEQNKKLDTLNAYVENVKGAWWFIGILVIVIAGAGGLLDWVLNWMHRTGKT